MTESDFFSEGSPFLSHPLLTAERTAQEIDFVEATLPLSPPARILDVGCGFGRHSIELARRGYEVTGIDPSAAMIQAARQKTQNTGLKVDFRQEWGECFQSKQSYDAAICLFTTLGQISEKGENAGLVDQVYAALKPGAWFVVEVPQRDAAVLQLKKRELIGTGEKRTEVQRNYDEETGILSEQFCIGDGKGRKTYWLRYRLYEREELEGRLNQGGFAVVAVYGDYSRASLSRAQATVVAVARKEG